MVIYFVLNAAWCTIRGIGNDSRTRNDIKKIGCDENEKESSRRRFENTDLLWNEKERKRKAAKNYFCFSFVSFFYSVAFANVVVIDDDVEVEGKSNHKHI